MLDLARNLCTDSDQKKCKIEHPNHLEWACSRCNKTKQEDADEEAMFLLGIRAQLLGGYPASELADVLSIADWQILGIVDQVLRSEKRQGEWALTLKKLFGSR